MLYKAYWCENAASCGTGLVFISQNPFEVNPSFFPPKAHHFPLVVLSSSRRTGNHCGGSHLSVPACPAERRRRRQRRRAGSGRLTAEQLRAAGGRHPRCANTPTSAGSQSRRRTPCPRSLRTAHHSPQSVCPRARCKVNRDRKPTRFVTYTLRVCQAVSSVRAGEHSRPRGQ